MKTTSLALTDSRMRLATVVLPDPVPPQMPIIMLTTQVPEKFPQRRKDAKERKTKDQRSYVASLRLCGKLNPAVNPTHYSAQQLRKRAANSITGRHHFRVIDRYVAAHDSHVCKVPAKAQRRKGKKDQRPKILRCVFAPLRETKPGC